MLSSIPLMDIEALRFSPVGRLVPISGTDRRWGDFNYWAFVPAPLPASISLCEATVHVVAEAAMAVGRLDAASDKLPNPDVLVRPTLTKEAVSTSALEGTFAPITEVLEGELVDRKTVSASVREVLNYLEAAQQGVEALTSRPISLNLIAPLQRVLVQGTRGDAFDAGQLRQRQVLIGSEHRPIREARFVPPPPEKLPAGVSAWEKWIHAETDTTLLVRVALAHYQFEALHPFSDGNGRLGRLIVVLQLLEGRALRHPLLNISEWLEQRKDEYQAGLLDVSRSGDFDKWTAFFCTAIKEQSEVALGRINRLITLRDKYARLVRSVPGSRGGIALRIAEDLIGNPVFDVPRIAKTYGVTYQSANDAIGRLLELGIIGQIDRRKGRPRKVFVASEVLDELEGDHV